MGYCQGMNLSLGFLLLVNGQGNEFDIFWLFIKLLKKPKYILYGIFENDMKFIYFLEYVTEDFIEINLPDIS